LLAGEGYARMSVEAIAQEAGTTKPTVYRRWPTKASLAVAALAYLQTSALPHRCGCTQTDLCSALEDFQKKLLRPNGMAMIGTLLAEERHTPELLALFRRRIVGPRRKMLRDIFVDARRRGELRPGADVEAAVNLLIGSYYARYLTGEPIPANWPRRIVATVLAGIL
jgi:AcrR family transcriptional regulator